VQTPAVVSAGTGEASFQLSEDGKSLAFELEVSGLSGITQAHIHLGARGQNGAIVAWLFPATRKALPPPGVSVDGTLAEGTIWAEDLVGPLANHPLSDLVRALQAGMAYANVHTVKFPAGEIRGQIAVED